MNGIGSGVVPRSYLYVPGNAPDKLGKALDRGADAVIVDLEDAVPQAGKDDARAAAADWLRAVEPHGVEVWVRLNPGARGLDDVAAIVGPNLAGVVAAKTRSAADLAALDGALCRAEASAGLAAGTISVVPLLESAAALLAIDEIAQAPRVQRLQMGEADLRADMGVTLGDDESELLYVRSHLVLASAAYGLDAPVAPVSLDFRDLHRLRASTQALRRIGYVGRSCIHPAQIPVVNDVFTPSADELARANDLVANFERAQAAGIGVVSDQNGRMVDEAVVRQARRLLQRRR